MIKDIELIENLLKIGTYNKMYRVNYNGLRLYVQEEPWAYFSGLTGALSASTFCGDPDQKRLKGWREGMIDSFGAKQASDYVAMTADFGTLIHMALITIKEKGCIDWKIEFNRAQVYFEGCFKDKLIIPDPKVINPMCFEYCKHVASLMQFVYEYVEEIYAIEVPAKFDYLRIATPLDLVCSCRQTPKSKFARTTINVKTSSQITKHQMEQAACELMMWNETYEPCEFTAIMRTKDFNEAKTPTFDFKYMTLEEAKGVAGNAFKRMELCLNSEASYFPNPSSKSFVGVTKIGEQPVITTTTIEEEWKANMELNNETLID
jgi:hypothetical protein